MDKTNQLDIAFLIAREDYRKSISCGLQLASKELNLRTKFFIFNEEAFSNFDLIKNKILFVDQLFYEKLARRIAYHELPVVLLQEKNKPLKANQLNLPVFETLHCNQINNYNLRLMMRILSNHVLKDRFSKDHVLDQIKDQDNLLKSIHSILIGLRQDGTIVLWNDVAEKTFKVKSCDVVGKKLKDCHFEWDTARVIDAVEKTLTSKTSTKLDDVALKHQQGKVLLGFTMNPFFSHSPNQIAILLYGADITERVKSRQALQKTNEMLHRANLEIEREKAKDQAILASIGDGLVVTDHHGKIVLVNKQARFMFDWVNRNVEGQSLVDIVPLMDEGGRALSVEMRPSVLALKTKNKSVVFANFCQNDHSLIPLQVSSAPVTFEENQIGTITLFRNISREKEIDSMKSEFVSTVSHELRTPLTSIREGVAQVFEELLGPVNDDQKEFLSIAMEEIDRLAAIINDLLDISKIESGGLTLKKSWVDLADLLHPIIFNYKNLTKSKEIELVAKFPKEEMVEIYCDPDKIKQIVTNLLTNAYKFTRKGGKIELELINEEKHVRVAVRDTGVGISEENLPKLFQKFLQVGRTAGPGIKGTGLGLAISKHLIEMHTGRIWVESKLNEGSCFSFTLPKLEKDFAAKENIEHGLEDLSENSNLSLLMFNLQEIPHGLDLHEDLKPYTFLKSFMKKMMRGPLNGLGDIFLNGANECIIILPGVEKSEAEEYSLKFKAALLKNIAKLSGQEQPIFNVEIGISSFPEDAESSESLLNQARFSVQKEDLDGAERRTQKRADFEINLNVVSPQGNVIEMHTIDISEGGLQLTSKKKQPVGKIFDIHLELPGQNDLMKLKSLVVWSRKTQTGDYLIGAKFLEVTDFERNIICNFIEQQNKDGFDEDQDVRKSA